MVTRSPLSVSSASLPSCVSAFKEKVYDPTCTKSNDRLSYNIVACANDFVGSSEHRLSVFC